MTTNATQMAATLPHWRRRSARPSTGAAASTLSGFEKVATPSSTHASTSDQGLRSRRPHPSRRDPLGTSGGATSLYAQKKRPSSTVARLNSSGVSQTKYTGAADAKRNATANVIAAASLERARTNA